MDNEPDDLVVDAAGNVFATEHGNHAIRKIEIEGAEICIQPAVLILTGTESRLQPVGVSKPAEAGTPYGSRATPGAKMRIAGLQQIRGSRENPGKDE